MYYIADKKIITALRLVRNPATLTLADLLEQGNPDVFEIYSQIFPSARRKNTVELANLFKAYTGWFERCPL